MNTVAIPVSNSPDYFLIDFEDYYLFRNLNITFVSVGGYPAIWHPPSRRYNYVHKLVLGNIKGRIDHVNIQPSDNRKSNLRLATRSQNGVNRHKYKGKYSSKYRGVAKTRSGKYLVNIMKDGKSHPGGKVFNTEIEAAQKANELYTMLFGTFAKLNNVN